MAPPLSDSGNTLENDGSITLDPSMMTVGSLTGSGATTIDTGSTLIVQNGVSADQTIAFAGGGGALALQTPSAFPGHDQRVRRN